MSELEAARVIFVEACFTLGFDKEYLTPILSSLNDESLIRLSKWIIDTINKTEKLPKMYEMSERIAYEIFNR